MQLTFTFDTNNKIDLSLLNKIIDLAQMLQPERDAQPEVAQNTGTTATGVDLSPEGSGVTGEAVPPSASPAPEKAPRKPRAKKEEVAPAPEVKSGQEWAAVGKEPEAAATGTEATQAAASSENATASATAADPATFTLDEVRSALQQFTAAKGVPAGIELLKKFNAGRISELAEGDYASFVAECAL